MKIACPMVALGIVLMLTLEQPAAAQYPGPGWGAPRSYYHGNYSPTFGYGFRRNFGPNFGYGYDGFYRGGGPELSGFPYGPTFQSRYYMGGYSQPRYAGWR